MKEQDIIELLLQRNEKGMDALLLHYGPLMRYIIAPICKIHRTKRTAFQKWQCASGKK